MKSFKGIIAVLAICVFLPGCSSFGVWSTKAQADITAFNTYAGKFLTGVEADAPALLAIASMFPQAAPFVPIAQAAISALESATKAAQGTSAAATDPNGVTVTEAQKAVNAAIGQVQTAVDAAKAGK